MPKTNKKEQPKCNPSTSAFFMDEKTTEPLLKVVPNIDGREGNDSSTKLPKTKKHLSKRKMLLVGIPGFEPGMTGPESVVLPLHHIPMSFCCCNVIS